MIGHAEQRGMNVFVLNQSGGLMFTKTGSLVGYTSDSVTVKQGATTYVFGVKGEIKFSR